MRRGGTVDIFYSAGNNGTTDVVNTTFRIFLSSNISSNPPAVGPVLFDAGATIYKNDYFTEHRVLTVPTSTPLGAYWMLWQIDKTNTTPEDREDDNIVPRAMTIRVGK
mgnify:CR=1 FL=1